MGRGMKMIAQIYGGLKMNGTTYIYDYDRDELVEESKFTAERKAASERKKHERIKAQQEREKSQTKLF